MSLIHSTATELLRLLESGKTSSVEIVHDFLAQISRHDDTIGAFLHVDPEAALAHAKELDAKRAAGQPLGRLAGLPVAIKDLLCTKGEATTCASRMLEHFIPPYDATVIARLREADAILLGKLNMDEFAMGSSNESSAFQITRNPWNTDLIPGGSSGGSAACIAASMAPLTLGSDTGGSIRQPASLCGVVGLKPTYGRVSRYGLIAFASSLDQIGPLTRTVEDAALLMEVIAGHDPLDSTSATLPVPEYTKRLSPSFSGDASPSGNKPLSGLRIGLVREYFNEGLDAETEVAVREAVKVYESLGATFVEVSLPHSDYVIATYHIVTASEASSNLARYDGVRYGHRCDEWEMLEELEAERQKLIAAGDEAALASLDSPLTRMYCKSRSEGFGPEVQRRILLGTYVLSADRYETYYIKALKIRRLICQDFEEAFKQVDLLLGPATPAPAYPLGEKTEDPLDMYLGEPYTVGANLAGICGIAFPCGISRDGLPLGLQLQAPPFMEERLLQGAHAFQKVTDWHLKRPNLS